MEKWYYSGKSDRRAKEKQLMQYFVQEPGGIFAIIS